MAYSNRRRDNEEWYNDHKDDLTKGCYITLSIIFFITGIIFLILAIKW